MDAEHATRSCELVKSRHLPLIWSRRARSTAIMASTSETAASFTTPALLTDGAADRWRKFLSSLSHTAATSGSGASGHISSVPLSWRGRAPGWASAATAF